MTTLSIKTITGYEFEVKGENYSYRNGIHYLNDSSYPDEIVVEVKNG